MNAYRWISAVGVAATAFAIGVAPATAQTVAGSPRKVVVKLDNFSFSPSKIIAMPGDTIVFEQTTDTPHNVQFVKTPSGARLADSYVPPTPAASEARPAGAATYAATTKIGVPAPPKIGPFLMKKGQEEVIVVSSDMPTGDYEFVCTPHASLGMKGRLVIQSPEAGD